MREALSILCRAGSPPDSKVVYGKAGLFEFFADVREGMKNSVEAVAEESWDKADAVPVCDISLSQGRAGTCFTREAQNQLFTGGRVRRKLSANGGAIKVAEVFDTGVAERRENYRRHGFLYRRQRFRTTAQEKQKETDDQPLHCLSRNNRPVNPSNGGLV